jgi:hypothetical protein
MVATVREIDDVALNQLDGLAATVVGGAEDASAGDHGMKNAEGERAGTDAEWCGHLRSAEERPSHPQCP